MASDDERPAEGRRPAPRPETSRPRRQGEPSQLDFELEFFGRILDRDPLHLGALKAQAHNLARRGHYGRALQLDRRLVRLLPERPVPWYNLACSYAVLGLVEPAFLALQRAVDLGYRHVRHLCRDPDLKALRSDPRFARLLRRTLGAQAAP